MVNGKRIAVVMPAYNAEKTLEATVAELPSLVDIRILVDDHSRDKTVELRANWDSMSSSMTVTMGMDAINRLAIARPWGQVRTW